MSDLISRQAAIDAFEKELSDVREFAVGFVGSKRILESVPSAQTEQRWIPCSERLPELGRNILVTTSWNFVTKAMSCGDHWEINSIDYKLSSVVAWMPLPEPYQGERRAE